MTRRTIRIGGAPLRGPIRVLSGALCGVCVLVFLRTWDAPPAYEAHAVLQVRPGTEALALLQTRLFTRAGLEATAARQGLDSPLALAEAAALNPLTTKAGESLGLGPQDIGIIVSVRLGDPDKAVRIANDLALQAIDLGQAGQLDAPSETLSLYRAEEDRLWQEVSALQSAPGLDAAALRELGLMQDEYAAVREALAQGEVKARVAARLRAEPFVLLARAQEAVALQPPWRDALAPLAAGALFLALLSTLIGREVSWPVRPAPSADTARSRSS